MKFFLHHRYRRISLSILGVVVALGFGATLVNAGPVTNPNGVPYAKLSIYKKLLQVLDFTGDRLEFGANGTDIAGSSNIIFRPTDTNGVLASVGAEARSNGTNTNLYIPGDLCLYSHPGGVISGTPDCRHVLSASGGATLWRESNATDPYSSLPYHLLEPIPLSGNTSAGVRIGTGAQPIAGTSAITLSSSDMFINNSVIANNYGNGDAALFGGNVVSRNTLYISGRLLIGGREVWRPGAPFGSIPANEGELSKLVGEDFGVDADLANGNQVTVEPPSSCADSDAYNTSSPKPRVACLCFYVKYSEVYSGGFFDARSVPNVKRCIDMANRF